MRARLLLLVLGAAGCAKQGATPAPNDVTAGSAATPTTDPAAGAIASATPTAAPAAKPAPAALARPTVPAEIAVPEGHKPVLMVMAKGVQIFDCLAEAGAANAWKLHAPRADLLDEAGEVIGSHYGGVDKNLPGGPYWESKDGSRVHGAKPVSAPNAGAIPLLRVEAADTSGTGVFSKISFIHRVETTGGVAPTGACTKGKTTEVAYTAKYYFYTAP